MSQIEKKGYKEALKGSAIFGGVQVFNIIINLIRGKLIAIILGPEGMGISSLFNNTLNTVQQISSLGLNQAIVKEISSSIETKDDTYYKSVLSVTKLLLLCTCIIGLVVTILLSKHLSIWAFGDENYRFHFVVLSIVVFLMVLNNGMISILQGARSIKKLAFSSIVGSLVGLIIGIPLYYFYGYDGIVPSMIVLTGSLSVFYFYCSKDIKFIKSIEIPDNFLPIAKGMISFGLIMMLSLVLGSISNYILITYISNEGSLNDVGFYQAANSITNQYSGLIFAAMSMDYFPRLAGVSGDRLQMCKTVNQQALITLLAICPIVFFFVTFAPYIVMLLLSDEFIAIEPLLKWLSFSILLKAISFPMGYVSFAKADKKVFFWLEGMGNILVLLSNLLFFKMWGIEGIGISTCFVNSVFIIIYIVLLKRRYGISLSSEYCKYLLPLLVAFVCLITVSFIADNLFLKAVQLIISVIVAFVSLKTLEEKTDFLVAIKARLGKNNIIKQE